jgi:hypothetical protein
MRSMLALGLIALVACGNDATTSPDTGGITAAKTAAPIELPSASDPAVHTEFVCGPSYPSPGPDVPADWCSEIKFLWLQPFAKHAWYFAWQVGGEVPGDTLTFTYGVYRSPKPIIRHDGIYQFDALNVTVEGHRRYLEASVRDNQPVNWGVFTK